MKRDLPNGQSFVFDAKTKTLFIIEKGYSAVDVPAAEVLVKSGNATKFSKEQLSNVGSALNHIALLG